MATQSYWDLPACSLFLHRPPEEGTLNDRLRLCQLMSTNLFAFVGCHG
jgi:hypothetical protein